MNKKAVVGICAAVIIVAIGMVVWQMAPSAAERKALAEAQGAPMDVIEVQSLAKKQITAGDWSAMKPDPGCTHYRIDAEGKKWSAPIKCASCQAEIPDYVQPPAGPDGRPQMDMHRANYKCPKCGKPACEEGLRK